MQSSPSGTFAVFTSTLSRYLFEIDVSKHRKHLLKPAYKSIQAVRFSVKVEVFPSFDDRIWSHSQGKIDKIVLSRHFVVLKPIDQRYSVKFTPDTSCILNCTVFTVSPIHLTINYLFWYECSQF